MKKSNFPIHQTAVRTPARKQAKPRQTHREATYHFKIRRPSLPQAQQMGYCRTCKLLVGVGLTENSICSFLHPLSTFKGTSNLRSLRSLPLWRGLGNLYQFIVNGNGIRIKMFHLRALNPIAITRGPLSIIAGSRQELFSDSVSP